MTKAAILIFFVFLFAISSGQKTNTNKPFIIEGQVTNLDDEQLSIGFYNDDKWISHPITTNQDGTFYLKIMDLKKPVRAQFNRSRSFLEHLFIAPGYHLVLTGDDKEDGSFSKTKKITGIGSIINQYTFLIEEDRTEWLKLNENDLYAFIKRNQSLRDSAYHLFFDKKSAADEYGAYFKKMAAFDNIFNKLNYLVCHADDSAGYSYDKSIALVKKYFAHDEILANLYRDEFLISTEYYSLMVNEYPAYLRELNCKKNPGYCNDKKYVLQKISSIDSIYKGNIKQQAFFKLMRDAVRYCRSFEELSNYKQGFPQYINRLSKTDQQEELNKLLSSKTEEFFDKQVGHAAPPFTAQDSTGKIFTLQDFKGKVVYVDLWGSWCIPCREFTPVLKTFLEKYKTEKRFVCVSIAINDNLEKWKKALSEDKPTWTQLFDNTGAVQSKYVAYSVPKFILINKEGNIVSFDTVMPDKIPELEKILNEEIEK